MNIRERIDGLRQRRVAIGATLDDVAARSGLDRSTIYRHEAGRIAKITRVTLRAWEMAIDELEIEHRAGSRAQAV